MRLCFHQDRSARNAREPKLQRGRWAARKLEHVSRERLNELSRAIERSDSFSSQEFESADESKGKAAAYEQLQLPSELHWARQHRSTEAFGPVPAHAQAVLKKVDTSYELWYFIRRQCWTDELALSCLCFWQEITCGFVTTSDVELPTTCSEGSAMKPQEPSVLAESGARKRSSSGEKHGG